MSDVMPRVILDELVALAVHHLGDSSAARELVDQVLAEHPDLAAAAVEAPSPAERLQAVDRLFGRVRWAVRERLPGVGRSAPAPSPTHPPMPTAAAAPQSPPAAIPAPAPPPTTAPASATAPPPPAPVRPATPPWAPARPAPPESPAPRTPVVPPAATIPQLEPPRTFIPPVVSGAGAEPEAEAAEPPAPPQPEAEVATAPASDEPVSPEPSPAAPARPEPARPAPGPPAAADSLPPAVPQLKLRPPPPMAPAPAEPTPVDGAETSPAQAIRPLRPVRDREPPPLQVEIVDDLYGVEAAARRRRRILAGLAGLAVAAGAAWLVVLADLPQYFQGWAWPGSSPDTTTAETPAEPEEMPPLETLALESPDVAADRPDEASGNGTQLILRLDQPPEPAAGPPAGAGEEAARVFIHYDAGAAGASDAAAALYARLAEGSGYATVVLRDVPYAIGSHRVRYYYAADRPAAEALVERLGSPAGTDWQLQDFSSYRPLPGRGTLEVFVPTN